MQDFIYLAFGKITELYSVSHPFPPDLHCLCKQVAEVDHVSPLWLKRCVYVSADKIVELVGWDGYGNGPTLSQMVQGLRTKDKGLRTKALGLRTKD